MIMTRKEEIIFATLELASEYGLRAISLSQIADRIGIKKPSLYNHFKSKDEIVNEMYAFLREKAQKNSNVQVVGEEFFKNGSLEEILNACLTSYISFLSDGNMLKFFKVLYSERSTSPTAAQIMLEETDRMTGSIKNLFYALVVHGKMKNESLDIAAMSYALTIHSLIDRHMDMITAGIEQLPDKAAVPEDLQKYNKWFCKQMEVRNE
jgi:AcrR family transcriptional regulator